MWQSAECAISAANYRIIETNQLGYPLNVYRLKSRYISFFYWSGRLMIMIGIGGLVAVSVAYVKYLQFFVIFLALFTSGFSLPAGWACLRLGALQAQNTCVIVCEQGLLQTESNFGNHRVEIVFWRESLTVRRAYISRDYFIVRREGKVVTLTHFYQDIEELVAIIHHKSELG